MPKQTDKGIYVLELYTDSEIRIAHKRFKDVKFAKGFHYYIGSAQKNLEKRIARHMRNNKKLHWHIDFLTANKNIDAKRIFIIPGLDKRSECLLVANLLSNSYLEIRIEGFGNSDCNSCKSHLLYSEKQLTQSHLFSLYHSTVLFIPSSKGIVCE